MTIRTATPRTESSSGMRARTSGVSPAASEAERGIGIGEAIAAECAVSAIAYANLEVQITARAGGMNATVIHGEGLGKRYRRGLQVEGGLRHSLEAFLRSPISSLRRKKDETFWALKDV